MKKLLCLLALLPAPALAQITVDQNGNVKPVPLCAAQTSGVCSLINATNPLPSGGVREFFQLATANTPAAPVTVYGGDYILAQTCTTYGSVNLRVLGPDGTTRSIVLSKTSADGNGGTGLSLGSYASVDATLTGGAAGCYVTLSRVPA